jgi:hypothetical protein
MFPKRGFWPPLPLKSSILQGKGTEPPSRSFEIHFGDAASIRVFASGIGLTIVPGAILSYAAMFIAPIAVKSCQRNSHFVEVWKCRRRLVETIWEAAMNSLARSGLVLMKGDPVASRIQPLL